MSNETDRFRRALERIRDYHHDGPVNEWTQAAAFRAVQELAEDALTPGVIAERRRLYAAVTKKDHDRAKELRRESSAGKRHFYVSSRGRGSVDGFWVCVLNDKSERPGIVCAKVIEVVGVPLDKKRIGDTFEVYARNLRDTIDAATAS